MKYFWVENGLDGVQTVNKSTITVGSYDFWNHCITYVTKLACKNGNLLINCKLTGILFLGQRGTFSRENIPGELLMRGTTHVSLHKHSHRSPHNLSKSRWPPENWQSQQNNYKTRYLLQNRVERFQNDIYASGNMLFSKFWQHDVDSPLYAKTAFGLRPCEKQGKPLSNQCKSY